MSETSETLAFFTQGWQNYQNQLSIALARLSPEQLALRAAPDLRSIDELARHVIACGLGGSTIIWKRAMRTSALFMSGMGLVVYHAPRMSW